MGLLENALADRAMGSLSIVFVAALISYSLIGAVYRVYFHPLSRYPGPWLAASTRLWYAWHGTQGQLLYAVHNAHKKYGEVIRIAPDELSYIKPDAWNEIYGHRLGKPELMKDPTFYMSLNAGRASIQQADRSRHGLLRKQASHGFSEAALRGQEEVIKQHAELLVERLKSYMNQGKDTIDMVSWFNYFTFDVMGVLVFGQSFDCLTNWGYHPWVGLIFDSIKVSGLLRSASHWPWLAPLIRKLLIPKDLKQRRAEQQKIAKAKAAYRKLVNHDQQDLISGYLKDDSGVSYEEYEATAQIFIIAGSETTATLMSGLVYYLTTDHERMLKLTTEIRDAFSSPDEITFTNASKLPYLIACLDETLRVYPPVAETHPRNTGPRAEMICGQLVPPWTKIGVNHWSTYRSSNNFTSPDEFVPERWISNSERFGNDRKEALQPFLVGPRNCIGRSLALFEMRLLVAVLLWHFNLDLDIRSQHWNQQKAYLLWEKPPLFVKLTLRS